MSEWTDIGEQLKVTRDKRGLSVEDISHEIRIPVGTLKALEENDYSSFPSPSYAKSFLSQYADFLKIDADEWLDCFETGNVLSHSETLDYLVPDDSEPRRPSRSRSASPKKSREPRESSGNFAQTAVIFLITGGLIAGAVWGFLQIEDKITGGDPPATEQKSKAPNLTLETPAEENPTIEGTPVILPPVSINPNMTTITEGGTAEPVLVQPKTPPPRAILVDEDDD